MFYDIADYTTKRQQDIIFPAILLHSSSTHYIDSSLTLNK